MSRPKGLPKSGGRKKGTANKITNARLQRLAKSGISPLEFYLGMMRDEDLPLVDRQWGAAKAGPLIHPALASVETTSHITGHLTLEALVAATLPKPKRIAGELAEMQENDE